MPPAQGSRACHNCRRRRVVCDKSIPTCNKCSLAGQECLGYGQLLRWTNSIASRGRMTGKTSFVDNLQSACPEVSASERQLSLVAAAPLGAPKTILADPVFQDLDYASRYYMDYYTSCFCPELVHTSSRPGANPFMKLVPLSTHFSYLRHIVVAVSALHRSNMERQVALPYDTCTRLTNTALIDALRAKQKAIRDLQKVLSSFKIEPPHTKSAAERDALLATVVFFINFILVDFQKAERDSWRVHMEAAGDLVKRTYYSLSALPHQQQAEEDSSTIATPAAEPSLGDCVLSDFLSYTIWRATIDTLTCSAIHRGRNVPALELNMAEFMPVFLRTEAYSYHSCPTYLMQLVHQTSVVARGEDKPPSYEDLLAYAQLLEDILVFRPQTWAEGLRDKMGALFGDANTIDVVLRTHIATAYRAAACLYMLLVTPELRDFITKNKRATELEETDTTDLAAIILHELSFIPSDSQLFKYITWPVLMLGVETDCPERRAWVLARMQTMLDVTPWGMIQAATNTLVDIWRLRDETYTAGDSISSSDSTRATAHGWLAQLRNMKIDSLIV